ncbi:MAG: helix-turn-helix transcriptional regulator [Cytophagaceae bacterium]|jgi:DNA-binding HxlR family transcriptional regulator|nr:helix-turn-helix transcriptional regulator [Cytophagaceae bacterium]
MKKVKESSTNQLNKRSIELQCPVTFTLSIIGGRWKPLLLWHLQDGKKRYSELKKVLPQISEKMLIQQLRELESDGLVNRMAKEVVPPYVEYSLSAKGKDMHQLLKAMAQWGIKYRE